MKIFAQLIKKLQEKDVDLAKKLEDELKNTYKQLEDVKAKLKDFTQVKHQNELLQKQINSYQKQKLLNEWLPLEKLLLVGKNHPNYEKIKKIKNDFVFDCKEKPLLIDDIKNNLNAIKPYLKIDFFETQKQLNNLAPVNQKTNQLNTNPYLI